MTASDANVRKIGTYFRISEEMLADTPQLTSYLSARAPEKLLEVEDTQILSGAGTGAQLSGIITDAAALLRAILLIQLITQTILMLLLLH